MATLTGDQARFILDAVALPALRAEHPTTASVITAIPRIAPIFYGVRQFPALGSMPIILNHTIHHRGQLSTYLRPMGAKVPSVYGEIFDARAEREQRASASR